MNKIDDKKIIESVKKDTNYQIKTTSADILRKYRSEVSEPVKEKHTKRNIFVFGGLGATLVIAATLFAVIFTSNNDIGGSTGGLLPDPTIKNSSFQEQLVLFSAFNGGNDEHTIKSLNKINKVRNNNKDADEEENENENEIIKETFEDICITYNGISGSLEELNKETVFKGFDFNKEIKGKKYNYLNELYYKGESVPFAKMYFNDKALVTEEEGEKEYQALYEVDEKFYSLKIEKEIDSEEGEKEVEYKLKFNGLDTNHSYIIEKENEFEGVESESCYSYKDYSDSDFINLIYDFTYKTEKEDNEQEKFEVEIVKDKKEYLFENIINKDEKISFLTNVKKVDGEKLAEDILVNGVKNTSSTTYTYKEFTFTI